MFFKALQLNNGEYVLIGHSWGQLDASYQLQPHLGTYFGQPFGHYPTFYTLMSVGRKKLSVCQNNVAARPFRLTRAIALALAIALAE